MVSFCMGSDHKTEVSFASTDHLNTVFKEPFFKIVFDHDIVYSLGMVSNYMRQCVLETKDVRKTLLYDAVINQPDNSIVCAQCPCNKKSLYWNKYGSQVIFFTKRNHKFLKHNGEGISLHEVPDIFSADVFVNVAYTEDENIESKKYSSIEPIARIYKWIKIQDPCEKKALKSKDLNHCEVSLSRPFLSNKEAFYFWVISTDPSYRWHKKRTFCFKDGYEESTLIYDSDMHFPMK